jgi:hypothetical protein
VEVAAGVALGQLLGESGGRREREGEQMSNPDGLLHGRILLQ